MSTQNEKKRDDDKKKAEPQITAKKAGDKKPATTGKKDSPRSK